MSFEYENFGGRHKAKKFMRRNPPPPPPPPLPIFQAPEEIPATDTGIIAPPIFAGESFGGDDTEYFLGFGKKARANKVEKRQQRSDRRAYRKEKRALKLDAKKARTESRRSRNTLTEAKAFAKEEYAQNGGTDPNGAGSIIQGAAGIIGGIFGKGGNSASDDTLGAAQQAATYNDQNAGASVGSTYRNDTETGTSGKEDLQDDPPAKANSKNNNMVLIVIVVVVVAVLAFVLKSKK